MATRESVVLFLNGERREVHGSDCFLSLSDYLRSRCSLIGTKIVCSEGDCGSCTVLIGRPHGSTLRYQPIDSCIRFMFQLDGVHVITVEGLNMKGTLTPIQQAMVDCHGSQCGFCTPGFVMAMTGAIEQGHLLDVENWRRALTGNLCRCTGYTPILQAAVRATSDDTPRCNDAFPPSAIVAELAALRGDVLNLRDDVKGSSRRAICPVTMDEALAFRRKHPTAKIVAGATDVGVQWNKRTIAPALFLDLNRISELEGVQIDHCNGDRVLTVGARTTWTELYEICRTELPEFAEIISVFGSPQIRHIGTLGGNIVNASPIADSIPLLFVTDAELELFSVDGRRTININQFYRGYKELNLQPDELLRSVKISLPKAGELLRLYKVSRRRDLDIATFTAAIRIRLENEHIAHAALAYGAVGPTVLRLRKTEAYLQGRRFDEATMQSAGDIAVAEITPITDVRGRADYRYQLARNVLLKFYHEHKSVPVGSCPG